jgi:adhesin transport system membrane fusion protein
MDQNAAKMNNIKDSADKEALAEAKRKSKRSLLYDDRISALDLEFMSEADAAILRRGKPRTYLISMLIVLFFAAMLTWAGLTRLDEVTKGQGQVVPAQAIQEIQYLEGGVLDALLVKQGDDVEEGQVVARISNVLAESTLREQKDNQASLEADIIRLRAEREGKRPDFPAEMAFIIATRAGNTRVASRKAFFTETQR